MVLGEARTHQPRGLGVVVDLLNTVDLRTYGDSPHLAGRDELANPEALRTWLASKHLEVGDLTEEDVALVRRFRDELRLILQAERTRDETVFTISIPLYLAFSSDGTPVLGSRAGAGAGIVGTMLAEIHAAGANGTWARLKVCASEDCRKAFYDTSRNRMGRWCSMSGCGNRAKTRTYRRRRSERDRGSAPEAVRPSRARSSLRASRPNLFQREGEYWSISYAGTTFRLKDAKGLRYLARLLGEPGREWHVLDLVGADELLEYAPSHRQPVGLGPGTRGARGIFAPVLDATARAAYRLRMEDLEEQLREAEEWGDSERGARAREEIDVISDELARATGLGGRDRAFGSDSDRARVNVTRVIKAALTRIDAYCPELRHHFASTLKTGFYCSYNPDPRLPTSWQL